MPIGAETLINLKAMASDPMKIKVLAQDSTCIGGLVIVLSNPDEKIVTLALETLVLLTKEPSAIPTLHNCLGITEQLETILQRHDEDAPLYQMALEVKEVLENKRAHLRDSSNLDRSGRYNSSLNRNSSRDKAITLQVRGMMDKADRDLLSRLLLRVRGVISITFDLKKKRCLLRTKNQVKPETLVKAITRSQTMTAQQVVKNEFGEEMLVSCASPVEEGQENPVDAPSYLSDEPDSPIVDDKALAKTSHEKKSSGWLNAAASFISNSFYW